MLTYNRFVPRLIDHDQRREELAQALWQVVTSKGIGAVSIREVAATAGVSAGSLRHLFPTREQLVIAAAEQMLRNVERRIRSLPRDVPPLRFAEDALAQTLPLDAERRIEFAVNLALVAEEPAVPALAGIRRQTYDDLRGLCRLVVGILQPDDRAESGPDDVAGDNNGAGAGDDNGDDNDGDDNGGDNNGDNSGDNDNDGQDALDTAARRLHVLVDGLAFHLFQNDQDDGWALRTLRAELTAIATATPAPDPAPAG